jgi:hypothetical protein
MAASLGDNFFELVSAVQCRKVKILLATQSEKCSSVVVICCCEKLVAEVGDLSGSQRKGNVRRCKPLRDNDWRKHSRLKNLVRAVVNY